MKKAPAGRYIYSNFNCNQKKPHRGDIYSNLEENQNIATL